MEEYYVDHYESIPVPTPSTLSEEYYFSEQHDPVDPDHTCSKTGNAKGEAMDNLNTVLMYL